jgi:hypothetical protein
LSNALHQGMPLCRSLAGVFTSTEIKNHHSRPLSNFWVGFGGRGTVAIFKAWNDSAAASIPRVPPLIFRPPPGSSPVAEPRRKRVRKSTRYDLNVYECPGPVAASADASDEFSD